MRVKSLVRCALPLLAVLGVSAEGRNVPLVDAVKRTDAAAVRALLQKRVDVNAQELDGSTALHWAVQQDGVDLVNLLIGSGADVQATNRYGVAPLSLACINGNFAIVERLLARLGRRTEQHSGLRRARRRDHAARPLAASLSGDPRRPRGAARRWRSCR